MMGKRDMDIKYKQCRLSAATHKKLRLIGAEHDLTVTQVVDKLIKDAEGRVDAEKPVAKAKTQPVILDNQEEAMWVVVDRFDDFWQMYPRKTDKKKAKSAWNKIKPNDDLAIKIITNVSNRLATGEWVKGSQFIPHPTTYLNGSRWDDEEQLPCDTQQQTRKPFLTANEKMAQSMRDSRDPIKAMRF